VVAGATFPVQASYAALMAIAAFKDLCIDANDAARLGRFWAAVAGRQFEQTDRGGVVLTGRTKQHAIWVNQVPEAKSVKHRVHLDIYTRALSDLEEAGSTVVEAQRPEWSWTVMADLEGGEYCAFVREELPAELVHGLVVDCSGPAALAEWWGVVYGAEVVHHPQGYSTVQGIPGMPIATMDFVPVPEPKTVKNRLHWDVAVPALDPLLEVGAALLRGAGEDREWHVMADPEGNEFCAFVRP
jgi:hypothetical protein